MIYLFIYLFRNIHTDMIAGKLEYIYIMCVCVAVFVLLYSWCRLSTEIVWLSSDGTFHSVSATKLLMLI